ncbi:outer membrane beta-barrel protein [Candidatus Palauibacter sp.]|uniref:outer membrane beta-barrel protein n=1 Tax=Candidatus Palauibacter sp. TaxID=3101350 RepID=UPI003B014984
MRRIIALLLPLLVAAPLMGQTLVGVRAGLNRSTVSAEGLSDLEGLVDLDARMGMVVGVDAAFPLAGAIELRVGGAYAQKGFSASAAGLGSISGNADYLQLSALARMGTPRNGGLSVGVLLGPWSGFLLSCNAVASIDLGELGSVSDSESCGDDLKGTDFGIAAGAGAELAVSEGLTLALDLIYWMGLADTGDLPDSGKNRSLAIQAGVVIPFGG